MNCTVETFVARDQEVNSVGTFTPNADTPPVCERDAAKSHLNLKEMTDEELLVEYRENKRRSAFEELVHRYEKDLFNYLRRYLNDAAMAEDAFQQAFLQLHLKCDMFTEGRRVRPWLYTIATNQAIDAQRRNKRHQMVSLDRKTSSDNEDSGRLGDLMTSGHPDPELLAEEGERREWVRDAINELPEQLRSAVKLIYFEGLKYREAAEVLDVPVGTVKSRLHTAVLRLTEAWKRGAEV